MLDKMSTLAAAAKSKQSLGRSILKQAGEVLLKESFILRMRTGTTHVNTKSELELFKKSQHPSLGNDMDEQIFEN